MTLTRSLSNYTKKSSQMHEVQEKIENYLAKKFRTSKSHSTVKSYRIPLNRFTVFLKTKNTNIIEILKQIKDTKLDPISLLDEFYSDLSNNKKRLSNNTIRLYITVAKDFLNSEGCKIYNEDLHQRFRLPKKTQAYEEGLTKKTIYRIIRIAGQKLATIVLIICSSGMRISEVIQLQVEDIDFTREPVTVLIRAQTTKTRETRITCISTEAKLALQDYMQKSEITSGYIFLKTHEQKISELKTRMETDQTKRGSFRTRDKKRIEELELELKTLPPEDIHAKAVFSTRHSLENSLELLVEKIPDLSKKTENGRNVIHFHAFRAWFKTQVTDTHESDFAESLMGHKNLKLTYYRQNQKKRSETYLSVEHALTISDTEAIDKNYSALQKDNLELRGMVDSLAKQLQNLESRIKIFN